MRLLTVALRMALPEWAIERLVDWCSREMEDLASVLALLKHEDMPPESILRAAGVLCKRPELLLGARAETLPGVCPVESDKTCHSVQSFAGSDIPQAIESVENIGGAGRDRTDE